MIREAREITGIGEWLRWRRDYITASRIAALFDAHPFLSREALADELRGLRGEIPNQSMRDGLLLEAAFPAAVKMDGKPWDLVKASTFHTLQPHRIACTPDFWIGDDGLLQAKTVSPQMWHQWHGTAPLAYVLQTACELLVTGRGWGVLAVMVRTSGYPIHYFDVPRHAAAEERLLAAAGQWWAEYDSGALPAAQSASELASDYDDGSHVDLTGSNELPALLDERAQLKGGVYEAEQRLTAIDDTLRAAIGSARTAYVDGWNISYRTQHRRETVIPERDIRVLRVTKLKGDEHE